MNDACHKLRHLEDLTLDRTHDGESMPDSLAKLAIQFADQNRQDQKFLREEIRELRTILAAVALSNGGEVKIQDKDLLNVRGRDLEFNTIRDERDRTFIIRVT